MSSQASSSNSPTRSRNAHVTFASQVLRPAPLSASINHGDPFLTITRAATGLQKTIQTFLDAQSEALLTGVGPDDLESTTSTPTPSINSGTRHVTPSVIPVRQPSKQRISLRRARRGLTRSMGEFAALKEEEKAIVEAEIQRRNTALQTLDSFTTKKSHLQQGISQIQNEDTSHRADDLRDEAQRVEIEIHELETKLYELRAKHRYLMTEAKELESSVSSKLSSYQASLKMVEKDMDRFLTRPPITEPLPPLVNEDGDGLLKADGTPFYTLHPKRRTLVMAQETWREEMTLLSEKVASVNNERQALLQGSRVWSSAVDEIQALEKGVRERMQQQSGNSTPAQEAKKGLDLDGTMGASLSDQDHRNTDMEGMISQMDKTIMSLASKLDQAEAAGWNLLICCIGAELEALKQGREILANALGVVIPDFGDKQARDDEGDYSSSIHGEGAAPLYQSRDESVPDTRADQLVMADHFAGGGEVGDGIDDVRQSRLAMTVESEDDEPHPDLLISQE